ncbi:hypothetical protein KKG71_04500 [Patescibacteria group bacterium]|nr:hypothetical protein [Patescibacteria group bacterium]
MDGSFFGNLGETMRKQQKKTPNSPIPKKETLINVTTNQHQSKRKKEKVKTHKQTEALKRTINYKALSKKCEKIAWTIKTNFKINQGDIKNINPLLDNIDISDKTNPTKNELLDLKKLHSIYTSLATIKTKNHLIGALKASKTENTLDEIYNRINKYIKKNPPKINGKPQKRAPQILTTRTEQKTRTKKYKKIHTSCTLEYNKLQIKLATNKTKLAPLFSILTSPENNTNPTSLDLKNLQLLHKTFDKLATLPLQHLIKALDAIKAATTAKEAHDIIIKYKVPPKPISPEQLALRNDYKKLHEICFRIHRNLLYKLKKENSVKLAPLTTILTNLKNNINPTSLDLIKLQELHTSYLKLNTLPPKNLIKALDDLKGADTVDIANYAINGYFSKHPPIPKKYKMICLVATGICKKFPEARLALRKFINWFEQMGISLDGALDPGLVSFLKKLSGSTPEAKAKRLENRLQKIAKTLKFDTNKTRIFTACMRGNILHLLIKKYRSINKKLSNSNINSIINKTTPANKQILVKDFKTPRDTKDLNIIIEKINKTIGKTHADKTLKSPNSLFIHLSD